VQLVRRHSIKLCLRNRNVQMINEGLKADYAADGGREGCSARVHVAEAAQVRALVQGAQPVEDLDRPLHQAALCELLQQRGQRAGVQPAEPAQAGRCASDKRCSGAGSNNAAAACCKSAVRCALSTFVIVNVHFQPSNWPRQKPDVDTGQVCTDHSSGATPDRTALSHCHSISSPNHT